MTGEAKALDTTDIESIPEPDDAFKAAFASMTDEDSEKSDSTKSLLDDGDKAVAEEASEDTAKQDASSAQDAEDKDTEDAEDSKDSEKPEESAYDRAMRRAEEVAGASEDADKSEAPEKPEKSGAPEKPTEPEAPEKTEQPKTEEALGFSLDGLDLPKTIKINGEDVDTKEAINSYSDDFAPIVGAVAQAIASKQAQGMMEQITNAIAPQVEAMQERLRLSEFMLDLASNPGYQDAPATIKSAEFQEWLSKQPESLRALGATGKAEDAMLAIDCFREATAKERNKALDAERQKSLERKNSLHSKSLTQDPEPSSKKTSKSVDPEAAFSAGFNSYK